MKPRADGRLTKRIKLVNGKNKDIYGYSEEEVYEQIAQIRLEEKGGLVVGDTTTMREWALMWFKATKEGKLSYSGENAYRNVIDVHIIPYFQDTPLKEIKPIHIQQFINTKSDKSSSLNGKIIVTLRQLFKSAILNGIVSVNPAETIKPCGIETDEKIPLISDQQEKLLELTKDTRTKLFINLALYCGLRRGEILALKWEDINIIDGTVKINKAVSFVKDKPIVKPPKTKAGNRTLPLPLNVIKLLCNAKKKHSLIVPNAKGELMSKTAYRRLWDIVIDKLQKPIKEDKVLTDGEKRNNMIFAVTPHKLRHTYCTMLYYAGVDLKTAQYLMGHAKISTTAEIYTHLANEQITAAKDKINAYIQS